MGFAQADLEIVTQVRAAFAHGPPSATSAASHELAEQVVENVGHGCGEISAEAMRSARAHTAVERGVAELVVGRPLLRVLQDLVGLVHFLETLFGALVTLIAIGVILLRQLAVRAFDRRVVRVARHSQRFVIVTLCHYCSF